MNIFRHRHFKYDIIIWAVRWYCKYGISYRDLEEMLEERGVEVDHTTIYRWVICYAPKILKKLKWYNRVGGGSLLRPLTPPGQAMSHPAVSVKLLTKLFELQDSEVPLI